MQELSPKRTITSLELVNEINLFRNEEGNRSELKHYDLLKIIRDEFEEEIGVGKISATPYTHPQNGQTYEMFEFTKSQATQVLVRESKFVRKAIIAKLERLESQSQQVALPSKKELALMVVEAEEKIEKLEAEKRYLAPRAELADKVLSSVDAHTTSIIAKELGWSAKKLNQELHKKGVQYKQDKTWVLYAKYQDKNYTETRTHQYFDRRGVSHTEILTVWTEKGRAFIHSLFNPRLSFSMVNRAIATA